MIRFAGDEYECQAAACPVQSPLERTSWDKCVRLPSEAPPDTTSGLRHPRLQTLREKDGPSAQQPDQPSVVPSWHVAHCLLRKIYQGQRGGICQRGPRASKAQKKEERPCGHQVQWHQARTKRTKISVEYVSSSKISHQNKTKPFILQRLRNGSTR